MLRRKNDTLKPGNTKGRSFISIDDILKRKHFAVEEAEKSLEDLRHELMTQACPAESRAKVWKLLLRITKISTTNYTQLISKGPSILDEKIRNDSFRTMTTDTSYLENVTEDELIRVLNAFSISSFTYVQGLNVLAAPFLLVLPEVEAFYSFSTFILKWCPLYAQPTMKGVHCGLRLLDMCLRSLDPALYGYLRGKDLSVSSFAFPSIMTFSACTPPLSELLYLWDYMFAYGIHLNILFVIAQLALIRTELLQSPSPIKVLRTLPPLRAKEIINLTHSLCKNLSADLYDKLVRHSYDESVAEELGVKSTSVSTRKLDDAEDVPAYMLDVEDKFISPL
ncbi:TBC-domain-containing protein [Backusella circina FSU 941]|nr:TBC-domain-containing protein [Backusella circina FSU 941]